MLRNPPVAEPTSALVRNVARSYVDYYARRGISISLELADRQHEGYVRALEGAGLKVTHVAADERLPDGVFIEDTAVVCRGRALITRLWRDREGEQAMVEDALRATHVLERVPPDATLDGGDVLPLGDVVYVGRSTRTNDSGIEAVRAFFAPVPVVAAPVERCLHLKTAVTHLGEGTLLAAPGFVDVRCFDPYRVLFTHADEPGAANCLRVHNRLLIAAGYPRTRPLLEEFAKERGLEVVCLEMSEFEKGDGSLTCLSVIW